MYQVCWGECVITATDTITTTYTTQIYDLTNPLSGARPVDVALLGTSLVIIALLTLVVIGIWLRGRV